MAGTTIAADAVLLDEVPASLVALTLNVYFVPTVRPGIRQDRVVVVQDFPPGAAVAVYPVTGLSLIHI